MKYTTLNQFLIEEQIKFSSIDASFTRLMNDIATASKIVNREINKAGLVDIIGDAGSTNVQGEEVKKLDVYANDQFISALGSGGECCAIVSEENDEIITIESETNKEAEFIVAIDPLDGSSNIDVNVSVGTIFSIFKKPKSIKKLTVKDVMKKGTEQFAAGYVIYGSSTMLVYTTGNGVNGFTLDPSIGEFCLSHPNLKIPKKGKIYSINEGNKATYEQGVVDFISYCQEIDKESSRPYAQRYVGSMVADFHRNLLKGGIFIYPATEKNKSGKLRLLYECNPMSMIIEEAGGKSTDGKKRILELEVTDLHQRTPIFIGSVDMVDKAMSFLS
jgi:fructose-1,6-bisphosphatase I